MKKIKQGEYESIPFLQNFQHDFVLEKCNGKYIPVSKLDDWKEFLNFSDNISDNFIYRGHKNGRWSLTPSLNRLCNNPTEVEITNLLNVFRKTLKEMELRDENDIAYDKLCDIELMFLARHHGLVTPTLDWTYDPKIALFFAFSDSHNDINNPYSAIFMFNKSQAQHELKKNVKFYENKSQNIKRAKNQRGLLTLTNSYLPIEDFLDEQSFRYFRKVYIKRNEQKKCMEYLESKDIQIKNLYPNSLEGAVIYCNTYAMKFFRKIGGGQLLAIEQTTENYENEQKKITEYLSKNFDNSPSTEFKHSATVIYEIIQEIRKAFSSNQDSQKIINEIYQKRFN